MRFPAIEGLRGWLAWTVVLSHAGIVAGIGTKGGAWALLERAGNSAVLIFIAISGFVICELVLARHEPWPRYILRRAFRIFPAYWVAYAAALAIFPLALSSVSHVPWVSDPAYVFDDHMRGWAMAMADHPWQQILLHVLLLQGIVPDSIWPYTGAAVLGPAWSLTLEWQFYLVAPFVIWLLTHDRFRVLTIMAILIVAVAFRAELFGVFWQRASLAGGGYIFLVGIGCRLIFDRLKPRNLGPGAVPAILVAGLLDVHWFWLAAWLAFFVYLLNARAWPVQPGTLQLSRAMRFGLESPLATYLGARSYSVYLLHYPIIQFSWWLLLPYVHRDPIQLFLVLLIAVVFATLIASEILHHVVERPMMDLGRRLAAKMNKPPRPAMFPSARID